MHQLVEYLLGVALLSQGLQTVEPLLPTLLGVLVLVNAAIVDGPLSAGRAVSRPVHRIIDVVLVVVMVLAALLSGDAMTSSVRALVLISAAVMAFLVWRSDYRPKEVRRAVDASGGTSEELGRMAGRAVGQGVNAWRRTRRN
jgi:hypothetical protein